MNKTICVVAGTRPEHIKLASVIRMLRSPEFGFTVKYIWSGQHYSDSLSDDVFRATNGPNPDVVLEWPTGIPAEGPPWFGHLPHDVLTAARLSAYKIRPHIEGADLVLVQGDTASAIAGAMAAKDIGTTILLAHLEAGLRSHDWTMPEEHVRVLIDRVADVLLCPSPLSAATCKLERSALVAAGAGQPPSMVAVVGQTGIDSLVAALADAAPSALDIVGPWALLTLHRAALVDDPALLRRTVETVACACVDRQVTPVWATHPRVTTDPRHADAVQAFVDHGGKVVPPLDYRFLAHKLYEPLDAANPLRVVITDSGGLAEDAAYMDVPTVIVRPTTERAELLAVFPYRVEMGVPGSSSKALETAIKNMMVSAVSERKERQSADYPYLAPEWRWTKRSPSWTVANQLRNDFSG